LETGTEGSDETNSRPTPEGIVQLGLGFWGSKALLSAVEIGLFTGLAEGPLDWTSRRWRNV
jgi:hypothetical protein